MYPKKKLVLHQETLRNLLVFSMFRASNEDTLFQCATDRTCPLTFTGSECTNC
jgi:hypothetical protein